MLDGHIISPVVHIVKRETVGKELWVSHAHLSIIVFESKSNLCVYSKGRTDAKSIVLNAKPSTKDCLKDRN